ncbi:MAG: DNA primase [Acidobacteria bacterium]|nr:MAG: DNA primase [Acidobacteriota bacterium]
MWMPRGFADQVRDQADIVRIISDYVTLKKRGANYVALCPFHREKTPSFHVHPVKQIFKCFGCGQGGDVFSFVMRMEGCDFPEAVRLVAEKSGIPMPMPSKGPEYDQARQRRQWREQLLRINAWARDFFHQQLQTAQGQKALQYWHRRGVSSELIEQMGLGYAPSSWDALSTFLRRRGVPEEQLIRSGLVVLRSDGRGYYDRFRGRVMVPITDSQGRVVAFGGRILDEDASERAPKYVNSPDTAVYTKGHHLFGLSYAREAIRQAGYAILVEGYFDFLIPFQAGIKHVVASLGTALTEAQATLLRRYTRKVVVNFDPDPAGRAAALRSLQMLVQQGFDVRVLTLPRGEDPDSFIRRSGRAAYEQLVERAPTYLDFVIAQATEAVDLNEPGAQVRALNEILPYVVLIPNRIERAASGDRVASRLMLNPQLVQEEMRRLMRSPRPSGSHRTGSDRQEPVAEEAVASRRLVTQAEMLLLHILLNYPSVAARLKGELQARHDALAMTVTYPLFEEILNRLERGEPLTYAALAPAFERDQMLLDVLERALIAEGEHDEERVYREAQGCLASLQQRQLERDLRKVQCEIERAQQRHDVASYNQLLLRKLELSNRLAQIRSRPMIEVDA